MISNQYASSFIKALVHVLVQAVWRKGSVLDVIDMLDFGLDGPCLGIQ